MKKIILKSFVLILALSTLLGVSSNAGAAAPTTITQPNTFCTQVLGGQWRTGPNFADNGECFTGDRCQIRIEHSIPRASNCDVSTYGELIGRDVSAVIAFLDASQGLPADTLQNLASYQPADFSGGKNLKNLSGACKDSLFFGIPTWYKYLPKKSENPCEFEKFRTVNDILLILLAVVEILTRLGAFLAVGYIIWGGIKFTISQGEPEGIANAKNTIINAVIGLVLTVMATALITFIGQRVG